MELERAGIPFVRLPSWRRYVDTGELARTLTRLCQLVADRFALAYRLTPSALEIAIDGESHAIELPDDDDDSLHGIAAVLRAINEHVPGDEQLIVMRTDRIVLADPRGLPDPDADRSCARPPRGPQVERELAALPPLDVPRFDEDGSVLAQIAAYVDRLARFAGHDHVHCEPRWKQDPGCLTFLLHWRPPAGGGLQVTVRVPLVADQIDPQPILDALNTYGDEDRARHLYRLARGPDRVDVALLDRKTADELRRRGELIEHPARDALRTLADCGFELSWLADGASCRAYHLHEITTRIALLARGVIELSATVRGEPLAIAWQIGGVVHDRVYGGPDVPIARVLADLNALLGASSYRAVAITGEPFFYGRRLVLLDPTWLAALARTRCILPGCVELDDLPIVLGAFPPIELPGTPPRLPRLDQLVRPENIREDDFKCSARPSDLGELIEELGRFARVAVEVGACTHAPGGYGFAVTYRGAAATVELDDEKYANVEPILAYLNGVLAARTPRHQLYLFRDGTWGGGVVRATDDEAAQLRLAGYIT